ncbi:hypothetical protein GCM10010329_81470 [Streptomyces spiroverticillatus]|uniref:Uncharacterized protein n=1 Tax=Streptomyces finlayi TaxID=67296 RepID=A0A919CFM6_9ACTN|nr:hypothetical protein [Streptomyces finlayi]GHA46560.1 hypothetical protein GCM10010329_81470 [Streptomyces spiroverticillatus]GHD16196.1 hypothetical protein GCM10010334_77040 [Streptomyces finlayi]
MKRGHAEILGTHEPEHQRITNLVQSTDQSWHTLWLGIAALAIAAL